MTQAQFKEALRDSEAEHWLYRDALNYVLSGKPPDAREAFRYDGDAYQMTLYNSCGARGGVVVVTRREPGKPRALHEVQSLDGLARAFPYSAETIAMRIAIDNLRSVRQRLGDAWVAAREHERAP